MAALGIALGGGIVLAAAQQRGRPLHEDVPSPIAVDEGRAAATTPGSPTQNPEVISAGAKLLPQPSPATPPSAAEPTFGGDGFAADRDTEATLDRQTASDGTLHYASVFNPDVLPFKRMSALNEIEGVTHLGLQSGPRTPLVPGGVPTAARDQFWGSLVLALAPGQWIAIPSVAPDMRILSYETEPMLPLAFSKDAADNFYVRAPNLAKPTTVRLVFNVDADAGYFAPALPTGRWTPRAVAAAAPPGALPAMPSSVASAARQSLAELGITETTELGRAFNALVAYHRAFAAGDPPHDSGNTYRDLFRAQVGVCRHRSFVFMITANALGIPTRYVTNEAHAFVEVWFPQRGWQRVDLGGAALNLEVHNGEDKTLHRPRAEDPFAKPDAYRDNYTQLRGDIRGVTDVQRAERQRTDEPSSGNDVFASPSEGDLAASGPGSSGAIIKLSDDPPDPSLITPEIYVDTDQSYKGRSQSINVRGAVIDTKTKAPLAARTVQIFIVPVAKSLEEAQWLGATITDARGQFVSAVTIPIELPLGTYELYAVTPKDNLHNAATSN